ncbi:ATP-binding protein, partial [Staphylococcus aureus]
ITYIFNKIYYFERFIDLLLFFVIMQGTFIFFLIFYENRVQKEQELKRNNEIKFENINFYSQLIEKKNLEIQKFNHDLNNIIISINEVEESKEVQRF